RRDDQGRRDGGDQGAIPADPALCPGRPRLPVSAHRLLGQPVLDVAGELGYRGKAILRVLGPRLEADRLQRPRDLLPVMPGGEGEVLADLAEHLLDRGGLERWVVGEDLVEDRSQAVDVGPLADAIETPFGLLGSHVTWGPQRLAGGSHSGLRRLRGPWPRAG